MHLPSDWSVVYNDTCDGVSCDVIVRLFCLFPQLWIFNIAHEKAGIRVKIKTFSSCPKTSKTFCSAKNSGKQRRRGVFWTREFQSVSPTSFVTHHWKSHIDTSAGGEIVLLLQALFLWVHNWNALTLTVVAVSLTAKEAIFRAARQHSYWSVIKASLQETCVS